MLAGLIAALTVVGAARAQTTSGTSLYTVKFVCGTQGPLLGLRPPAEPPVKPGNYATVINIEALTANTPVATNVSVANGKILNGPGFTLSLNQTQDITCADISRAVGSSAPFITGYVNIVPGSTAISVTSVYTSQGCNFSPLIGTICSGPTSIEVVPQQFVTPPPSSPVS